jgi:hypothetical protein
MFGSSFYSLILCIGMVMDVRDLDFPDGEFDVILDKGCSFFFNV